MLATLTFSKKAVMITAALLGLAAVAAFAVVQSASASHSICTTQYAPVCGEDGKTYGNRCQAIGHTLVKHNGPCGSPITTPITTAIPAPTFNPAPTFGPFPTFAPAPTFRPMPTWTPNWWNLWWLNKK